MQKEKRSALFENNLAQTVEPSRNRLLVIGEHSLELLHKLVGISLGEGERRKETQGVGARAASEDVLLLDEAGADVLVGHIELYAYHEASATNIYNMWQSLSLETAHKIAAYLGGIVDEVLLLDNIQYG